MNMGYISHVWLALLWRVPVCFIRDKFLIFYDCLCVIFSFRNFSLLFVNCVHLWPIFVCFSTVLFSLSVEPLLSPTVFTPTICDLDMCADAVGPLTGYSRADLVSLWTPELRIDRKTRKTLFHYQLWCPKLQRFDNRYDRRRSHRFGGPKSFFVSARRSVA